MYCTFEDLKKQASEDFLRSCAEIEIDEDDPEANGIDMDVINEKIVDAQGEIDSYCQAKYPVPFDPIPGIIRKIAVDITLYNLVSKRGYDEDKPEINIVKRYKDAIRFLENLAKGVVTIGPGPDAPVPGYPQTASFQSQRRRFSRQSMEGF